METAGGRVRGADPRRGPQARDQPLSGILCLKVQLGKKGVRSGDRRVGIREPPAVLGKEQPYFGKWELESLLYAVLGLLGQVLRSRSLQT